MITGLWRILEAEKGTMPSAERAMQLICRSYGCVARRWAAKQLSLPQILPSAWLAEF